MSYVITILSEIIVNKIASHMIDKAIASAGDYIEDPTKNEYRTISVNTRNIRCHYDNDDDIIIISKKTC